MFVSSVLFLRVLTPALLDPVKYDLIKGILDSTVASAADMKCPFAHSLLFLLSLSMELCSHRYISESNAPSTTCKPIITLSKVIQGIGNNVTHFTGDMEDYNVILNDNNRIRIRAFVQRLLVSTSFLQLFPSWNTSIASLLKYYAWQQMKQGSKREREREGGCSTFRN